MSNNSIGGPAKPHTASWHIVLAGALTAAGYLLPFLGRSFTDVSLVHPRLLSYVAVAIAFYLALTVRATRNSPLSEWITATLVMLFALSLAGFPWEQAIWVVSHNNNLDLYAGSKLTLFVVTSFPLILLAIAVSPLARDRRFTSGMIAGTVLVGALGIAQMFRFRSFLQDPRLLDLAGFGTISLATIFALSIAAVAAWSVSNPRLRNSLAFAGISLVALSAMFLLGQRTPFLIGATIISLAVWMVGRERSGSRVPMLAAVAILAITIFVAVQAMDLSSEFPSQFERYSSYLASGDASAQVRWQSWAFSWSAGFDRPFAGHGLGAFALAFPDLLFPHNLFLEMHYELGLVGGLMIVWLFAIAVRAAWHLLRHRKPPFYLFGLLAVTVLALKGTTFEQVGLWAFWLYMCVEAATPMPSRRSTTRSLENKTTTSA